MPPGSGAALESRAELSRRYLRELAELVGEGQIGAAVAARIADDLFEPEDDRGGRRVRLGVWRAYLKDRTGHIGLHLVDGAADPGAPD